MVSLLRLITKTFLKTRVHIFKDSYISIKSEIDLLRQSLSNFNV